MEKTKLPYYEIISLAVGELIVSALTGLIFYFIGKFNMAVIYGALLGAALIVANFLALAILSTRAVNNALLDRGSEEMDDEAAAEFAKRHQAKIQLVMTGSYIVRMVTMAAVLVIAFIFSDLFNPIATAVSLVMFRPILMVSQFIMNKRRTK